MFKKILFALIPVAMLALAAVNAKAGDDVLDQVAGLNVASISSAEASIDDGSAAIDIDGLTAEAGSEKSTDAVEACFRRVGYGCGGYGGYCGGYNYGCYNNYNYGCYNNYNYGCYNSCYSVNTYCYQPVVTYRPVCYTTTYNTCYTPCYSSYSSWGCW